ncbi:MAG: GDP-mannose 4,6-dehydratase [Candidatus Hydrogenedentes bacterium]|nr:GDP-mannose 4,6-dehydratase [Candidatus Hydrogenedentota bacterium]MBI3118720.1 GDP-mannose 4,6-dehydratase [Candidatus Hydrogenedentota bacterium]
MKRALITGVAGFIGSHLAEALLRRGDSVVGLDSFNDYYDPAIKRRNLEAAQACPGFSLREADICEEHTLRSIFHDARPDVVVHLAARAGVRPSLRDPNLYHRVNVIGTQHVLDACRDLGPAHLVIASSSSVYGNSTAVPFRETDPAATPLSPYGATKRMNELQSHVYHHLYGLNITLLRFFTAYGPRQRPDMAIHKFARLILENKPVPMFGDGSMQRDYTYIDDIIDGVVKTIDQPFPYEIFNLGESQTTSLAALIQMLEVHLGQSAIIERLPEQPGDVRITYADIRHARERLGYNPCVSMQEGIARFVAWLRQP